MDGMELSHSRRLLCTRGGIWGLVEPEIMHPQTDFYCILRQISKGFFIESRVYL
jgi:hypothetical protein